MSSANKHKSESTLDRSGLPGWLRWLADAVESGEVPVEGGQAVSVEGFRSLKISVKENYGGGLSVKLGVKFPAAAGALIITVSVGIPSTGKLLALLSICCSAAFTSVSSG